MKVRYSPRATADIIGIADYLTARTRAGELLILHIRHGARAPVKPEEL